MNAIQWTPEIGKKFTDYLKNLKQKNNESMMKAFGDLREKNKKNNASSTVKKLGNITVSNTDSVERCMQIKARLNAKLSEIFASDLDDKLKMALSRDILFQLNNVEKKIHDIRRRKKAEHEEKTAKKDESEAVKRRRRYDMQKRSITIRRDYLFSAEKGGLDPNNFIVSISSDNVAVSFDIGGVSGGMPDVAVSVDTSGGAVDNAV